MAGEFDLKPYRPRTDRIKKYALLAVVLCIAAGAAVAIWKRRRPVPPVPPPGLARQIADARSAAQYSRVLELVAGGLHSPSVDPAIVDLSRELQEELQPDIRWRYLINRRLPAMAPAVGGRPRLTPQDEFYFIINLAGIRHPTYAYLFLVDTTGNWTVLAPNKAYLPNANPLAGTLYQVPDNLKDKLHPSETPGAETMFAVTAYWRIDDLENLAAALASETNSERARALGNAILARIRLEQAKPDGIRGLKVGTFEFDDAGRTSLQKVEKN